MAEKPAEAPKATPADEPEGGKKSKLVCESCAAPVPYNVARFCWFNKPKFGGNVYCMDCQKLVPAKA